jgi:hypothetical protein
VSPAPSRQICSAPPRDERPCAVPVLLPLCAAAVRFWALERPLWSSGAFPPRLGVGVARVGFARMRWVGSVALEWHPRNCWNAPAGAARPRTACMLFFAVYR